MEIILLGTTLGNNLGHYLHFGTNNGRVPNKDDVLNGPLELLFPLPKQHHCTFHLTEMGGSGGLKGTTVKSSIGQHDHLSPEKHLRMNQPHSTHTLSHPLIHTPFPLIRLVHAPGPLPDAP